MKRVTLALLLLAMALSTGIHSAAAEVAAPADSSPVLRLKQGAVDLRTQGAAGPLSQPSMLMGAPARSLYVVQFKDVITLEMRRALISVGAEIDTYLPDYAFLVRMTPAQAAAAAQIPAVSAVGRYQPDWKVAPSGTQAGRPTVQVHTFPGDEAAVGELIRSLGGKVRNTGTGILTAELDASAAATLARNESVTYVDDLKPVILMNDVARTLLNVDTVDGPWAAGLDGTGQVVGIADTGLDTGNLTTLHEDLKGQLLITPIALGRSGNWSDPNGHGTHAAGSIVGDGSASGGRYKGVAPGAKLLVQSLLDSSGGLGGLPLDLTALFGQAAASGVTIHANSWGVPVSAGGSTYDSRTRQVDEFVWNNRDFTILFAAGNDGSNMRTINAPGTAKNAITVGASQSNRQDWGVSNPNQVAANSSRGPTPDGRIKPDVVAPGTNILSVKSSIAPAANFLALNGASYAYMSGTSTSTPLAAGAAALVRQHYTDVEGIAPSASLIKATLINTARDLGYGWGAKEQGWGRIDVANATNPTNGRVNWYEDEATPLSTGQYQTYRFMAGGGQILKFTLVWSDYPGAVQAGKELVNDLDLEVIGPDGKVYRGNCFASNTASTICKSFDRVNNVENVYFTAPTAGAYDVKVRGFNVPMGPQTYSLVVSGDGVTGGPTGSGQAPLPTITAPAPGSILGGTVMVAAVTANDAAVSRLEFYVDGSLRATTSTKPFSFTWNTRSVTNNIHTLTVKAYDASGAVTVSAPVAVTVDNQMAGVGINAPASGSAVHGQVTVATTVTGIQSPARVDFFVDGTLAGSSATPPFSWTWDSTGVTDGSHALSATVYNLVGAGTDMAPVTVTVDNQPPSVSLTLSPASPTVSGTVGVTANAADEGSGLLKVEFYLDGALKQTSTSSPYNWAWDTSSALTGSHTLSAKAYDRAGNVATSAPQTVQVNLAPSVSLTNPVYAGIPLRGTVQLTASAWDADGIQDVAFYVDGALICTVTANPYSCDLDTTSLASQQSHTIEVKATDGTGNQATTPVFTVQVDNQAPTGAIIKPAAGSSLAGSVKVEAGAADDRAVKQVTFLLDGSVAAIATAAPYAWTWETASAGNGSHTLTAVITDTAGNTYTSAPVTVTVDAPPTVAIADPIYGQMVRGTVQVTATADDPGGAVQQVEFYVDGVLKGSASAAPYTFDWDTTKVYRGAHKLTAKAVDSVGNGTMSDPVVVTVDNTGPSVTIATPSRNAMLRGTVAVRAVASDLNAVSRVEFYLDGQKLNEATIDPYVWQWDTTLAANTVHELSARAYDAVGNVTVSAPVTVTVDNALPTIIIENPTSGQTVFGEWIIKASASDNQELVRVEFYADGAFLGYSTRPTEGYYTLAWNTTRTTSGTHVLTAKGYDRAGNVGSSDAISVNVDLPPTVRLIPPPDLAVRGAVDIAAVATDSVGVTEVQFFLDGASEAVFIDTDEPFIWHWDSTATPDGKHLLRAKARDGAFNETISAPVTVTVDNQAPAVVIASPVDGAMVTKAIPITAQAVDNQSVAKVSFYVDGVLLGTDPQAPFTWNWPAGDYGVGKHVLTATAVDRMGNTATSAPVTVTVDTPPGVTITAPKNGTSVGGSVAVSATAVDEVGISRVEFYLDGALKGTVTESPYTWTWDTSGERNGTHTLTATAYNTAGTPSSQSVSVTVDNQGPSILVYTPASGSLVKGSIQVQATATDQRGVTQAELFIDGVSQGVTSRLPISWTWDTATATDGDHTLSVKAWDKLGNVTTSKTLTVTVDNTKPALLVTPPAESPLHGVVTFAADASDLNGITRVEFYLDGLLVAPRLKEPYAWTWNTASAGDGAHKVKVRAYDATGNFVESSVIDVTVDAPPTLQLKSFGSGGAVRDKVTLTATVADLRDVPVVEFYVDGVLQATVNAAPYTWVWDTNLLPTGSTHTVVAKARDASGNTVTSSTYTVVIDNELPSVAITGPKPVVGEPLIGKVQVSANATDNRGVAQVEFLVDDQLAGFDTTWPYSWNWDTSTATSGAHALTVRATDRVGNVAVSDALSVTVDLPPTISFTAPTKKGAGVAGNLSVAVDAQDDNAVTKVEFFLDGLLQASLTAAPWTWTWNTGSTLNGIHALEAFAVDAAGNRSSTGKLNVNVDNQGPAASINSPAAGATVRRTVTVMAGVRDTQGISKVEFYLDGTDAAHKVAERANSPWNWTWDTTTTSDGTHQLYVIAYDGLGNGTLSPGSSVKVDNLAPTVSLDDPIDGSTQTGTIIVRATAADTNAISWVEFYLDGALKSKVSQAPYTWSWNTATSLSDGMHTLKARAYDQAGNFTDSLPIRVSVDMPPTVRVSVAPVLKGTVAVTAVAKDLRGVAQVEFYLDGNPVGTAVAEPYTWNWNTTTVTSGTTHTITAKATDTGGNVVVSAPVTVAVDNQAPSIAIVDPTDNSAVFGRKLVKVNTTDDRKVTVVKYLVDGKEVYSTSASPFTWNWDTTKMADGNHTLVAKAYDAIGNVGASATVTVRVDLPPTVAITAPARSALVKGTVPVTTNATDSVGIAQVEFLVDGKVEATVTAAPWNWNWDTTQFSNANHGLIARVTDTAGNVTNSPLTTVTVDNQAPSVGITMPADGSTATPAVNVTVSAQDNRGVVKVEIYLDGNLVFTDLAAPFQWSWDTSQAATGQHTLSAKAYDAAGNVGTSPDVRVTVP